MGPSCSWLNVPAPPTPPLALKVRSRRKTSGSQSVGRELPWAVKPGSEQNWAHRYRPTVNKSCPSIVRLVDPGSLFPTAHRALAVLRWKARA